MADTAQNTPLSEGMNQDFAQALKDVEARSVQPTKEQVEAPVSGSEKDSAVDEAKPEGDQSEQPTKDQPAEEKLAAMRADDYTRKTQELARQRDELTREREAVEADVQFSRAWQATAVAYNRATPEVQQEVKALLEGKLQPRSQASSPAQGATSERIQKLLDSFEETDRSAVKDIFDTMLSEADSKANEKIAALERKLEEMSSQTTQESEIRQTRDAQEAFSSFARECPEWEQMTDRERIHFQRDITEDTNLDPVAHFKSVVLPVLRARGQAKEPKTPDPTTARAIQRGNQAVLTPSNTPAAPRKEKPSTLQGVFEMACAEKGL